jgi:hypothetical protein
MKRAGALLLAAGAAMAGDWPQFRGPSASGYETAKPGPLGRDEEHECRLEDGDLGFASHRW